MKVTVLIENTSNSENLYAEHGLSILVKTDKHNVLVDTGASGNFALNAEKLGIDLKAVDTLILSHGHYDHCGGVCTFGEINSTASIYINQNAFGNFRNTDGKYIGIDEKIKNLSNLVLTSGDLIIDEQTGVFSDVHGKKFFPTDNARLLHIENGKPVCDNFNHEQYTVITENGKAILLAGCAHRGIVNIMESFYEKYGKAPDAVFSGFHLMKKSEYNQDDIELIESTAKALSEYNTVFYTGHCTGEAINCLESIMGNNLVRIYSGMIVNL